MDFFELYYEKHKNEDFFEKLLTKIKDDGKLEVFKEIVRINPYYRITDFDYDFYSEENIKEYGCETLVLLQNRISSSLLKQALRENEIKEKLIYFAHFKPSFSIQPRHLYNESFSIELLEFAKKKFDSFELTCFIRFILYASENELQALLPILKNDEYLLNLRYLLTHTNKLILSYLNDNYDIITSKEGTIFINSLINCSFDKLLEPVNLIRIFRNYKPLFKDEALVNARTLGEFIKDENRFKYCINSPKDLINFFKIRENYYKNKSEDEKCKVKFGLTKKELADRIHKYLIKNRENCFLTAKEIEKLITFEEIDKEFLDRIETKYREMCKRSVASSLCVVKKKELTDITDLNYRAIIHHVRFNSTNPAAKSFETDPRVWDSDFVEGAYISGTLIDQYSLGTIGESKSNLIGFSEIEAEDIIDMGLGDIYSSMYYYYGNLINPLSNFATIDDFDKSTEYGYNEVVLRRFKKSQSLKPDFTLAFDKETDFNRSMQEYFNIPILLIDSMRAAERMQRHVIKVLYKNKLIEYGIYLYKFYTSFMYEPEIVDKYFNKRIIESALQEIMKRYSTFDDSSRSDILFILDIIEKINAGLSYTHNTSRTIDVESFRKKLNA